jgi:hypothetical protein
VRAARAAPAGGEIELEVRVPGVLMMGHRRPPEVRVQQHASCIDHGLEQSAADGVRFDERERGVTGGDGGASRIDEQRLG